tara:strand:+ start:73 stop:354 length:282 start_codon:yes stop_codon:yes gene_type:complete
MYALERNRGINMKKSTQHIVIENFYNHSILIMRNVCENMDGNPRCISGAVRYSHNNHQVPKGETRVIGNKVYVGGQWLPRFDERGKPIWTITK